MHVLHVITGLLEHGAERMLVKTAIGLRAFGIESSVISLMPIAPLAEQMTQAGISVYSLNLSRGQATLGSVSSLSKLIRKISPDIIQGWMYHGNLAASFGAVIGQWGCPVVWNIRQTLYGLEHEKKLTRAVIRLSALTSRHPRKIIYNSSLSAQQHEDFGFPSSKTVLISNGFDTGVFSPVEVDSRGSLSGGERLFVVGLAARFHPMKDHATFIKAAQIVLKNRKNVVFRLAGSGVDPGNAALIRLISDAGLSESIELLGEQRDMVRFYQGLDALALPSAWGEAFPNVLGEAMSCGVPCVATDIGDSQAIIGETGFIVPPRAPENLAESLILLADEADAARDARRVKCREKVIRHYDLSMIAGQYAELYRSLA